MTKKALLESVDAYAAATRTGNEKLQKLAIADIQFAVAGLPEEWGEPALQVLPNEVEPTPPEAT